MSPDASGEVVPGRLIAGAGRTSFSPDSPVEDVGMYWLEATDGTFHRRDSAVLPVIFAAVGKLGGLGVRVWVNPILAGAALMGVFFCGRRFSGGGTALVVAAVATVAIGLLGVHNAAAFGAVWRTGWASTNEQTGFGGGYFSRLRSGICRRWAGRGARFFRVRGGRRGGAGGGAGHAVGGGCCSRAS